MMFLATIGVLHVCENNVWPAVKWVWIRSKKKYQEIKAERKWWANRNWDSNL